MKGVFGDQNPTQAAVKEQEVKGEVLASDLQRILGTDKAEVAPQLDQKVLQLAQQPLIVVIP